MAKAWIDGKGRVCLQDPSKHICRMWWVLVDPAEATKLLQRWSKLTFEQAKEELDQL